MKIQITDQDGNVVYIPSLNATLERDLFALFPQHPRRRFLKNRRTRHAIETIEKATLELRMLTRFAAGEAEGEDT